MKCTKKFLILAIMLVSLNVLISCRNRSAKNKGPTTSRIPQVVNNLPNPPSQPINPGVSQPGGVPYMQGGVQPLAPQTGTFGPNGQCICNAPGPVGPIGPAPGKGGFSGRYKKRVYYNKDSKKKKTERKRK